MFPYFSEVVYSLESSNLKMLAKSCLVNLTHVHTGNNYESFVFFKWEFMFIYVDWCFYTLLITVSVSGAPYRCCCTSLSQQQTLRLLLIHDAEEIIAASKGVTSGTDRRLFEAHLTFRLVIKKYCLTLSVLNSYNQKSTLFKVTANTRREES